MQLIFMQNLSIFKQNVKLSFWCSLNAHCNHDPSPQNQYSKLPSLDSNSGRQVFNGGKLKTRKQRFIRAVVEGTP